MKKPILCLDFDGVIHSYTSGWAGPTIIPDDPVPGALSFMIDALNSGWDVVICSSRGRFFWGRWAMRAWLKKHAQMLWYGGMFIGLEKVRFTSYKPSALITIDDRALTFNGTWPALNDLKSFKPWNKRRESHPNGPSSTGYVEVRDGKIMGL